MIDVLNVFTLSAFFATSVLLIVLSGILVFEAIRCTRQHLSFLLPLLSAVVFALVLISVLTYEYLLGISNATVHFFEMMLLVVIFLFFILSLVLLRDIINNKTLMTVGALEVLLALIYIGAFTMPLYTRAVTALTTTLGVVILYVFVMYILVRMEQTRI